MDIASFFRKLWITMLIMILVVGGLALSTLIPALLFSWLGASDEIIGWMTAAGNLVFVSALMWWIIEGMGQ